MPKETHRVPISYGIRTLLEPIVADMALKWHRPIDKRALSTAWIFGPMLRIALYPESRLTDESQEARRKGSEKARAEFWEMYEVEPDWCLALLGRMRKEITQPASVAKAVRLLLNADWMHGATNEEVIAEIKRIWPHLPKIEDIKAGSVEVERTAMRKRALKKPC